MPDACLDQGASLRALTPRASLRLVAVIRHGDPRAELPLLWQLCSALEACGDRVAVLDASTLETPEHPGLQQLMDHALWLSDFTADAPAWPILPAALGLQALQAKTGARQPDLKALGNLFKGYGVIVVYGRTEPLAGLLGACGATPLVAVSPAKATVLSAYQALKRTLQAGLTPTLVSLIDHSDGNAPQMTDSVSQTMRHCARTYLGREMGVLTIRSDPQAEGFSDDVRRLALHLLENAVAICQDADVPSWGTTGAQAPSIRSH
ncbi:MAG TPA: hypothetical protein VLJ57_07285 [Burkholderiaceae bacterium]|nr:hypothetical protein [Burkholderiaceae bacterium]